MTPENDVDALLELWDAVDPDPVDLFEDALAARLGLRRGPGSTKEQWRRDRVRFIDAATGDDDMTDPRDETGDEKQGLKPERVQRETADTETLKPKRVPKKGDQDLGGEEQLKPERVQ